jgi:hypothetical protein
LNQDQELPIPSETETFRYHLFLVENFPYSYECIILKIDIIFYYIGIIPVLFIKVKLVGSLFNIKI